MKKTLLTLFTVFATFLTFGQTVNVSPVLCADTVNNIYIVDPTVGDVSLSIEDGSGVVYPTTWTPEDYLFYSPNNQYPFSNIPGGWNFPIYFNTNDYPDTADADGDGDTTEIIQGPEANQTYTYTATYDPGTGTQTTTITIVNGGFTYDQFCFGDTKTLADIDILGIPDGDLTWYDDATPPNVLPNTDPIVGNTTYYVNLGPSFGCANVFPVVVEYNTPLPEGSGAPKFCSALTWSNLGVAGMSDPTLADLDFCVLTGATLTFYNAAGNPIPNSTLLQDGVTYYVTQTLAGCESAQMAIVPDEQFCACSQNAGMEDYTGLSSSYDVYYQNNPGPIASGVCNVNITAINQVSSFGTLDSTGDEPAVPVSSGFDPAMLAEGTNPVYFPTTSPLKGCSEYAIRLNSFNDGSYGSGGTDKAVRLTYDFIAGEVFTFDFAAILRAAGHQNSDQPYFKALIVQNGTVIQERCIIANEDGCTFYNLPGAFEPILYSTWSCVKLSTASILGQKATAVFIVSDCAQSGDFGYAYVDNIYIGPNSGANCSGTFGYVIVESTIPDGDSYETCSEIVVPVNPQCEPAVEALNPVFPITVVASYKEPESTGNFVSYKQAELHVYQNGQTTPVLVKNNPTAPNPGQFQFTIQQSEIANPYGYFSFEVELQYNLACGQNGSSNSTSIFRDTARGFKFCPTAGCASSFSDCTGGSGGTQTFDLTLKETEILAGIPAAQQANYKITYYNNLPDAENGVSAIASPGSYQTAVTKTVYARLEFDFNLLGITPPQQDCFDIVPININIGTAPAIAASGTLSALDGCGSGTTGTFNLTSKESAALAGVNPTTVNVSYHTSFSDADLDISPIATPANFTGTQAQVIHVRVENISDGCYAVTDFPLNVIQVGYNPPVALNECDQDAAPNDGMTLFDLNDATTQITNGYPNTAVSYHIDQADADANASPLPVNYTNTTPISQTIYVRIEDSTNPACYVTETLVLNVLSLPGAFPGFLELCDADNDGSGTFTFNAALESTVSGGAGGMTVTFHQTQAQADANTSPITTYTSGTTTIYARVDNGTCYNTSTVTLTLKPSPVLPATVTALELCDDNNPGDQIETFDLTLAEPDLTQNEPTPGDYTVAYYASLADLSAGNAIGTPTAYANTTPGQQTIHVIVTGSNGCTAQGTFNIVVNPLPTFNAPQDLVECDQGTQDNLTPFDLTQATAQIAGGNTNLNITYYELQADAQNGTGTPLASPYTNTTPDLQTIYVRIEDTSTTCVDTAPLVLDVIPAPVVTAPAPYVLCDLDNSGDESFNLSSLDATITGGASGVTVSYHPTQADADNDTNILPDPYLSGTVTIYARVEETSGAGCYNTVAVDLVLESSPTLPAGIPPLELCDYTNPGDQIETFDLTLAEPDILALEAPNQANFTVTYYASQADLTAGNPIPAATVTAYDNTTPGQQTIYVEVTAGSGLNCTSQMTFDIIVNPLPSFNTPQDLIICDDASSDGTAQFDLSVATAQITGSNPGLSVTYYPDQPTAESGLPADQLPMNYTNQTPYNETIGVRIEDTSTSCYVTTTLDLQVNQAPAAYTPTAPLVYCDDDNDGVGTFDLTSLDAVITGGVAGVTVSYHETQANAENDVLAITTPTAFNNTVNITQTIYARVESPGVDCYNIVEVVLQVVDSPQAELPQNLPPLNGCDQNGDGSVIFDLTQMAGPISVNEPNPGDFTLEYYEDPADIPANPISVPTAYANTSSPQTIYVVVTGPNGCTDQTSFEIIANDLPAITTPVQLELCDVNNPGDEEELFNLDLAIPGITMGDTSIQVTFHQTQGDADTGANPIASPYPNEINNETIYIRAVDGDTGCSVSQGYTLTLIVNPLPSPEIPAAPLKVCDTDNDGFVQFDLGAQIPIIQNGEPNISITFHLTQAEADSGANPIDTTQPFGVTSANNQTLYVRATNDLTGCYVTGPLELEVVPTPVIGSLEDLYVCDDGDANGIALFDLTKNKMNILGGLPDSDYNITFHTTQQDAEDGVNAIVFPAAYTNTSNGQVIYVRMESIATGCIDTFDMADDNSFTLNVEELPVVLDPTPLAVCDDDYNTVPVSQVEFDLTVKEGEIAGLPYPPAHYEYIYYASQADMDNDVPITDPTAYTNITNPQTIHVKVVNTQTQGMCADHTTITLNVLPLPSPSETDLEVLRLEQCDDDNDGVAALPFDLTQSGQLISAGEPVVLTYYKTEYAAETGGTVSPEYIATPTTYVNEPSYNEVNAQGMIVQVIYARVDSDVAGNFCYVIVPFEIRVVPAPELNEVDPFGYTLCEDGNTGSAELFPPEIASNLYDASVTVPDPSALVPLLDPAVNQDLDLNNYTVTYYPTQQDAVNGTNAIAAGHIASTGDILYVRAVHNDTGCASDIGEILITVEPRPAITEIHVSEEFCSDGPGGSVATVDLTVYDAQINPGAPANTEVVYYANMDAYMNGAPITTPGSYTTIEDPQVIIAVVVNTNNLCESATQATIEIDVEQGPMVDLSAYDGMVLCVDSNPATPVEGGDYDPIVIDTGLDPAVYTFEWTLDGTVLAETGPSILVTAAGTYQVSVTNNATGCESVDSATIVSGNPPEFEVEVLTESFSEAHTITIMNVTGAGDYEFSIDHGPWMDLGEDGTLTFTGVSAGTHIIYGRDKNGCGTTAVEASIIDYPKFFTPNGDGYNDTWNIIGISDQPNARIFIFDRYGKLLKQLSPTGPGWDGTYNGRPMPSSDYWFRVEYIEPMNDSPASFKANFTLKR